MLYINSKLKLNKDCPVLHWFFFSSLNQKTTFHEQIPITMKTKIMFQKHIFATVWRKLLGLSFRVIHLKQERIREKSKRKIKKKKGRGMKQEGKWRTGKDKGMCMLLPKALFSTHNKVNKFLAMLSKLRRDHLSDLFVLIFFSDFKNILLPKLRG